MCHFQTFNVVEKGVCFIHLKEKSAVVSAAAEAGS